MKKHILLCIYIVCAGGIIAQNKLQGFSGGMMLHTGYLQGEILQVNNVFKGVPFGLGGVARLHLGQHWMLGAEGYVSTLKQMKNGSYIKYGWGGILGVFYWQFEHVMPYVGIMAGGGSQTSFLLFSGSKNDWEAEEDAIFHKQAFGAVNPFIGCDFILTSFLHLTLKMDCLNGFTSQGLVKPMGPRLYIGCIFYR